MSAGPATLKLQTTADQTIEGTTLTETYEVFTTSNTDGPLEVLAASGLPFLGQSSSIDGLSLVTSRRPVRQSDSTTHWLVEITYSRQKASDQDTQNPPTLRPVKRWTGTRWVERALMKDEDGNPILTSAKSPFNPPITVQVPHSLIFFQRWVDAGDFTIAKKRMYEGKTNSSSFGGEAAGRVMCTAYNGTEEWEQDGDGNVGRYWIENFEFEICFDEADTFRPIKVLDCDYFGLNPSKSFKRMAIFIDANGDYTFDSTAAGAVPVPQPVCIDSSGAYIPASGLPTGAHYLEWNTVPQVDFNGLMLPLY